MGESGTDKDRQKAERLGAALRENLRKRKAQARELDEGSPAQAGAQTGEADAGTKER